MAYVTHRQIPPSGALPRGRFFPAREFFGGKTREKSDKGVRAMSSISSRWRKIADSWQLTVGPSSVCWEKKNGRLFAYPDRLVYVRFNTLTMIICSGGFRWIYVYSISILCLETLRLFSFYLRMRFFVYWDRLVCIRFDA